MPRSLDPSAPAIAPTPGVAPASTPATARPDARDPRPSLVVAYDDPSGDPGKGGWRWFEADFPEVRWRFVSTAPGNRLERRYRRALLVRTRCAWEAARLARRERARLLVSTEPDLTYRVALALATIPARARPAHVAWAFNFAGLPRGRARLALMRAGFARVDRFVVSSTMERDLYGQLFGIPEAKFDVHLWSVGEPMVADPARPEVAGDYICAAGSNARDYRTLLDAVRRLPEVRLVIVASPASLEGLDVPPNVEVRSGIPLGMANNIIAHARFAVLPLADGETPNGHVTLVNSMKLARASVVTDSRGIADYAHDDDSVRCAANSAEAMATAIGDLWRDRPRAERLGTAARAFARAHCTEASARDQVGRYLADFGLLPPAAPRAGSDLGTG